MKAYKLFRKRKDGTLGPLFINRTQVVPFGQWMPAECHATKGFAYRPGWHCAVEPKADHLKTELRSGEKRVWCEVEVTNYQEYKRPAIQGGTWILASYLKVVRELA
jgi:hypothetical protein